MFVKEPGVRKPIRSYQPSQTRESDRLAAPRHTELSTDACEAVRPTRPVLRLRVPDEFVADL